MKDSNLYCCFSIPLRDYLLKNGMKYEVCAANPNTGNLMWIFMRTEKLNELLSKWSSK